MTPAIYTEKLADVRYITAKLERLPEKTRMYVVGYVEGAADASEQPRPAEQREGAKGGKYDG